MNVDFLGHFHPLVVHLPIGILLLAIIMEYLFPKKNSKQFMQVVLLTGASSAILSSLLGWLLSFSGDYDNDLLTTHKWSGILLSIFSVALWIWKQYVREIANYRLISHFLFGLVFLTLVLTGHFGGSLTHGADFLSFTMQKQVAEKNTSLLQSSVSDTSKGSVYDKIITPILTVKCYNCHNAGKKKGNLRMQTYEALLKGGKTGPSINPGDPVTSELIKRVLLDIHDDKRMPPKGKKQLTNEEINVLYWWIQHGASKEVSIQDVKKNDTLLTFLSNTATPEAPKLNLPLINRPDSVLLSALKNTPWEIHPIAKESPYLDVSAVGFPALSNEQLKKIEGIAPNIAWLNLANTQINDEAMLTIAKCTNLLKLSLSNTAISAASVVALTKLTKLQTLTIMYTKIDDKGLRLLCEMKGLKKINCWNSLVTKKMVEECRKKYPGIEINDGDNTIVKP